jgi:hypothetical protein
VIRPTLIDGVPAELPHLRVRLRDGRIGWYQRSQFDCLRAAVATATQIPYDEIDLGEQTLRELYRWAEARGLRVEMHLTDPPIDRPVWIGFTPVDPDWGMRHTAVGAYERVIFAPGSGFVFAGGVRSTPPREFEFALTMETKAPSESE